MISRVLLIANPGSRRGRRLAEVATRALEKAKVEFDLVLTERPGHGAEVALERHGGYDAVFTLGGDGTAMEVASALVDAPKGSPCLIGILPGGTGNLLAGALGISRNVGRAVHQLVDGEVRRLDLGRMDSGHRFAITAGVGIDAEMTASTSRRLKRYLGVLAYVIVGIRMTRRAARSPGGAFVRARVTIDGETREHAGAALMVANLHAVLRDRVALGDGIRDDDGLLDLCVFSPRTFLEAFAVFGRMVRRDFSPTPMMTFRRGRVIRVETDRPMAVQADGEMLGFTPFTATVEPLALHVLVPRR